MDEVQLAVSVRKTEVGMGDWKKSKFRVFLSFKEYWNPYENSKLFEKTKSIKNRKWEKILNTLSIKNN